MSKKRPSTTAILTMVAFTASCIGLLLFLWLSFGGSIPLAPEGYRFSVEFDEAVELATQAQVDISGVTVGHVVSVGLDHRTGLSRAVIQIDKQFAPRPANTRAILRQKTLLGETYIELSPGNPNGPKLPDNGHLPQAQVSPTVQLDQIFSTFDPTTRKAFQTWMQQGGIALTNRGEQFNAALASLYPFATNVESVLTVLHRQGAATTTLLHDGGQVFSALSRSPTELQSFVRNNNALFAATTARDVALADTIKAFPAFLSESTATIKQLTRFSQTTKPLVDELRPAALELNTLLPQVAVLAPELRSLLINIGPLTQASKAGFPALERFLNESVPFFTRLAALPGRRGAGRELHQHLQARDRRLLRQQHRDHRGDAGRGDRWSQALHPDLEPGQPRGADALSDAPRQQPQQPLPGSGRLQQAPLGAAGVRELSVHEPPAAGSGAVAVRHHNFCGGQRVNNCAAFAEVLLHV